MAEARLYTQYKKEIVDKLMDEFKYDNIMGVPKLKKIIINVGYGNAINDAKTLDVITENIGIITGQKAVKTKAKKSVSNFKLREGQEIGAKVTLRGKIMFEFLDRLINLALPRTRDFQGVPNKSFDGRGNYTMGIKEHTIFPEIDVDKASTVHGMDVSFVTSAETDEEAFALLKHMGMPFKK
ncbi:50S ribosomal protein L5 [Rhodohalobacter sp. SW132]|uniref:50S ribosomal protein L5 n=1 Tax=Rhodohalobacter sp. SW132 TaxID=2293433 RepID=UPI000E286397|nr:50S ribosomal protein L5 [Rhodohalobacter sp. SW132]REL23957.1 50S ribosomal protein L5 [Rhodohalobacter sp. SW132]